MSAELTEEQRLMRQTCRDSPHRRKPFGSDEIFREPAILDRRRRARSNSACEGDLFERVGKPVFRLADEP